METTIYTHCSDPLETTIMENQMEKQMEHEMETGIM